MSNKILFENGKIQSDPDFGEVSVQQSLIKNLVNEASQSGKPLVVHFHGGLVARGNGIAIADRLQQNYEQAGGVPLFFVWQTGILETIKANYQEALDGKLVKWAMKRILRKLSKKLNVSVEDLATRSIQSQLGDSTVFTSQDVQTLHAELEADAELNSIAEKLVNAVNSELAGQIPDSDKFRSLLNASHPVDQQSKQEASTLKSDFFIEGGGEESTRGLISIASFKVKIIKAIAATIIGVLKRYKRKTDHGMPATAIEELSRRIHGDVIGAKIWGFMKQDSAQAFEDGNEYGGTFLLDCIENANPRPRVLLVGHSAGAVFICNLLASANSGNFELALLAPAATSELFDETITDHGDKISEFRMFTMRDKKERADILVGDLKWLYPSSLLYLISGILELDEDGNPDIDKPVVGMERFYDTSYQARTEDHAMLQRVRSFMDAGSNRVVWSISEEGDGLNTESCDHGFFDEEPKTVGSLEHIIEFGF